MRRPIKRRSIRPTLLLVGEGLAEFTFLASVKAVATRGGNGPSVTLRQANGKGALHVVEYAHRQWRGSEIDKCAVLLDGDTTCHARAIKKAMSYGVSVMTNTPCLEASLLRLKGVRPIPDSSAECKAAFAARFGGEAHQAGLLARHFSPDVELLRAFADVEPLAMLLTLLDFMPEEE